MKSLRAVFEDAEDLRERSRAYGSRISRESVNSFPLENGIGPLYLGFGFVNVN